uniref:Uncharacterized protein n=1 Tax=Mycobacterium riyadhense TaxID=486698 RepID=A0A653F3Q2_9MYCO|nr:hypothetical protein BIN_B_05259 [Mycobacterium riyadhense]
MASTPYSDAIIPAKTPVWLPRNVFGSMPADSKVSQAVSSNSRCWGSMVNASRGEIPKKSASKSVIPAKKPPKRLYEVPA